MRVKETKPSVAVRRRRSPARPHRCARPRRDSPRAQRPSLSAARGSRQRDREGAGALLQRVHGWQRSSSAMTRSVPASRPLGVRLAGRRDAVGAEGAATRRMESPEEPGQAVNLIFRSTIRRAATTSDRGGGRSQAARRSTSTRRARSLRGTLRRLLPPADADPGLERRSAGFAGTADERPRDGDGCGAPADGYFSRPAPRDEQLPASRSRPRSSGAPRRCRRGREQREP